MPFAALLRFGFVQCAARFATLLSDFLGVLRTRFRAAPPLPQSSCSRAVSTALSSLSAAWTMSSSQVEFGSTGRMGLPTQDMNLHLSASRCCLKTVPSVTRVMGIQTGLQTTRISLTPSVVDMRSASMACTSLCRRALAAMMLAAPRCFRMLLT